MTNKEKLSKALQNFKTKYPSITSADLQTFIIGWQEAVKNCFTPDVSGSCNQCDCDEIAKHPKITDRVCQKCGHRWSVI
mgnify:CR=1 FL=1